MPTNQSRVGWIIGIFALVLIVVIGVWAFSGPERSVAAYCNTWKIEGEQLQRQWSDTKSSSELGSITVLMAAPRDLADLFDKLAEVAPDDIRADVKQYHDAWETAADNLGDSVSDPLSFFLAQTIVSVRAPNVEKRIDQWMQTHCPTTKEAL